MPVKIRLQRRGKKGKPYFWIIAADSRSKRDGKYLEKIGFYNPTTNPAQIDLDVDTAVKWLQNGAQPTDTARAILSYKGALLKNHLAGGVRKGALTEEQAEAKFNEWLETKTEAIDSKKANLSEAQEKEKAEKLAAEKAVSDKRAADAAAAAAPAEEEATEEGEAEAEATTEEGETKSAIEEAAAEAKEDNKEA
ncbi:30S ribosomal protein S16 [Aequorivita marina]|uniref:30S ribosomal protein S16 n=1 Tax=Aequorivita marina TaxID=3073654 RepID=UPI0028769C6E|nr:30S ribosomal protein S16 [Aequorivita sp. S2608]MDS1299755.1 30S ribosomal protein S16 [Aequorivita sp. S2608]